MDRLRSFRRAAPRPSCSTRRARAAAPVLALISLLASAPGAAAQEPEPRTIAVTGDGSVTAQPDQARVRLGVFTEAPTAAAASRENAQRMAAVIDALRGAGLAENAIQTVQLTIEPVYDYPEPPGRPRLRGFQARNVVEARFEDLTRLGEVLDAAIAVGGNTVEGVFFELRDPGPTRARALEAAVSDARLKAQSLARAAEVSLGEVRKIDASYGAPIPYPMPHMASMELRADQAAPPPVNPGEMTVTATARVVYAIE